MLAHAIEYVCAVARHRNISKAAAELYISQPALTKYINRVEQELNLKLFDRSHTPITLTPSGELFVEKGEEILALESHLLNELNQKKHQPKGKLALGFTPEFCNGALPYILPSFLRLYPDISVTILEGHNHVLLDSLEKGKIDLAIMSLAAEIPDLEMLCIEEEPTILAMPASHPIARAFDLSANSPLTPYYLPPWQIDHQDFVLCSPELGMGRYARSIFQTYQLHPKIIMTLQHNEAAFRMASADLGLVFVPVRTPLRITPIRPMAYFSIENPILRRRRFICYKKWVSISNAALHFIGAIQDAYAGESMLKSPTVQLLHVESRLPSGNRA